MKRLEQQFQFILEIDKAKRISRQTYCTDGVTKENDAEHGWHAALMAILLSEYANEPIDVLKTVTMLLIHDIVEIDAGDTYAYDEEGIATQAKREQQAAQRIYGLLPEEQGNHLLNLWREFEAGETAEAKFAKVMDRVQPIMLNAATDGKAWQEHQVQLRKILNRNEKTAKGSTVLWEYALQKFILPNVDSGKILHDGEREY